MSIDYKKEGKIAIFTLNRPEALNSIDPESLEQLSRALIDFKDDDELMVGIITGAGDRAFSVGADIKTMLPEIKKTRGQPSAGPPTIMRGLELWKPMIAAVNGACLGGGLEIALACDLRIASENATFGLPEVTLGLIPGWGGTQRLPRVIPLANAAELLLTGRPIVALDALRIGLVNKVVPLDELMSTARQLAEILCRPAPLAVRAAKQAMIQGTSLSLDDGLKLERTLNDLLVTTEDFDEGCNAFAEKRRPVYKAK
ncbi:MAG: enoyl-CoA hydratase/isomerase family protein [Dehalococcoidia bacterium]|nr:enoyl-CoA hydratase/isomerase family protein [Dehalococcoidia bacterium]